MSKVSDPFDEKAAQAYDAYVKYGHSYDGFMRAVAAALREAAESGFTLGWRAGNDAEEALEAEIARLKAELESLQRR